MRTIRALSLAVAAFDAVNHRLILPPHGDNDVRQVTDDILFSVMGVQLHPLCQLMPALN